MWGVWTGRGGAAGNPSQTHAARNKKRPWNVWPSPKSLPPPSARAPSLGEKQEAPILWNKFPLMWTCWWRLKGGRWTHMTIRIHFTAFIADCVTVCCFRGLRRTEFLANRSSQTPAVRAACLMHLAKKSVTLPFFCALLCPWALKTKPQIHKH